MYVRTEGNFVIAFFKLVAHETVVICVVAIVRFHFLYGHFDHHVCKFAGLNFGGFSEPTEFDRSFFDTALRVRCGIIHLNDFFTRYATCVGNTYRNL